MKVINKYQISLFRAFIFLVLSFFLSIIVFPISLHAQESGLLRCSSHPAPFDGNDPLCDGGNFGPGVYAYVWPQDGIKTVEQFITQCNGFYHSQRERAIPYEALGGDPITATGSCEMSADVHKTSGSIVAVVANFEIDGGVTPSVYALHCSQSPGPFDGNDPLCDGGLFNTGVYAYVWPQDGIEMVDPFITQCDGFYHSQRERAKPYEALGGAPITVTGSCEVSATVYMQDGGSIDIAANFQNGSVGGNISPTASFTVTCTELTCSFDASASTDDGTIVEYSWDFGDGGADSGMSASHTYSVGGSYAVTLTVVDDGGLSDTQAKSAVVTDGASIYALMNSDFPDRIDPSPLDGQTVAGDIHVFTTPETGVSQVQFFLDDSDMTGAPIQREGWAPHDFSGTGPGLTSNGFDTTALSDGDHSITALMLLTDGSTDVIRAYFTVENAPTNNLIPIVDAGPEQFVYDNGTVFLSGTAIDNDGQIVSHQWQQISGNLVSLEGRTTSTPTFTAPSTTGVLIFEYTATDNVGAQQTDTVSVYVSKVLFSDSFDSQASLSNWAINDDSGILSHWEIIDDQLFQSNSVNRYGFNQSYLLGTTAYLNTSHLIGRSSMRFSVDVLPRTNTNGQSDGNGVGIIIGNVDSNTYYRLSMNARYGFTRLEKRDGESFTTIAANAIGYIENEVIELSVEVNTGKMIVMINSEPIFGISNFDVPIDTIGLYCQDRSSFDNVVVSDNSLQPRIAISSPLAFSVIPASGDDVNSILAEAVVLNQPAGYSVQFIMDGGDIYESSESGNLHVAQLQSVSVGNHEIIALLRNSEGMEVSRDSNLAVGFGGDYIIAVGDSMTNGSGDENPDNNNSADGRIVSIQGFAAQLNDELTSTTGLPQIVFNEGIPGDISEVLNTDRIDSILERHPDANKMLLLIGTNDVWADLPVDEFEDHVMQAINVALTDNIEKVYIARIHPFYNANELTLNPRVIEYNERIEYIASDPFDDICLGPDFYSLFEDQQSTLYSSDGVHPNDAGFGVMAQSWSDVLTNSCIP